MTASKPTLAVWKFSSCDGCQLSILDCEDELLSLVEVVDIGYFPEATRQEKPGPYAISLVEGSITTPEEAKRIKHVREQSGKLIAIGACATAGGIQALRNFADVREFSHQVYAHPEYIETLNRSTPIAAHVKVDFELRGCPVNKYQLLEILTAFLQERAPVIPRYSVCEECKRQQQVCVMVAHGTPCLGPITQAGCGALCPAHQRGCYGCFGPKEQANAPALSAQLEHLGVNREALVRMYRTYNAGAQVFVQESRRHEQ